MTKTKKTKKDAKKTTTNNNTDEENTNHDTVELSPGWGGGEDGFRMSC